jgi:large subunit ribosomal protein L30
MAAAPPRKAAPSAPAPAPAHGPANSNALSWQAKFDGLFGKSTPPDRKSVLAVTSASKEPLSVHVSGAAVSLPRVVINSQPGDGDLAVRQVEEQDEMFEDREPGSLPAVRVPPMAPPMAWAPVKSRYKNTKPVQAQSIRVFPVGANDIDQHGNTRVTIFIPGGTPIQVSIPRKAGTPAPRYRNANHSKPRKTNNKSRDAVGGGAKKSGPLQASGSRYRGWSPDTK